MAINNLDIYRPFHWPSGGSAPYLVEPTDENCPQAWDVTEQEHSTYLRIGQVVKEGQVFQAWGRVWETSLGTLVPLWFPSRSPDHPDYSSTSTIELALERIVQAWQQYTD